MLRPLQFHQHFTSDGPALVNQQILKYGACFEAAPSQDARPGDAQLKGPKYTGLDVSIISLGYWRGRLIQQRNAREQFYLLRGRVLWHSGRLGLSLSEKPSKPARPADSRRPALHCSRTCRLKSALPPGKCRFDSPAKFAFDEAKGPGCGVEFGGEPEVVGAPQPELVCGLDSGAGVLKGIVEVSERAFDRAGQPGLRQAAQLVNRRSQVIERVVHLDLGYPGISADAPLVKILTHSRAPRDHSAPKSVITSKTPCQCCQGCKRTSLVCPSNPGSMSRGRRATPRPATCATRRKPSSVQLTVRLHDPDRAGHARPVVRAVPVRVFHA